MALTRLSVRTCLIWRQGRQFSSSTLGTTWARFVDCLKGLEYTCTSAAGEEHDWSALASFLGEAPLGPLARSLADEPGAPFAELAHHPLEDGGEALLPENPVERFAAAYYLGQLAFVCGRLSIARDLARLSLRAYQYLPPPGLSRSDDLALRILHFLAVTLALETDFHTRGYDIVRDRGGRLQARRIQRSLCENPVLIEDFGSAADLDLLRELRLVDPECQVQPQLPTNDELVLNYIRYYWSPVPTRRDLDNLKLRTARPLNMLGTRALSYVLSQRVSAGTLHFRLRHWDSATETFEGVRSLLKNCHSRRWHPALQQLEDEATLYCGRLKARSYRFDEARKLIASAKKSLATTRDEFAFTKAIKYQAEVEYRQQRWREAEERFKEVLDLSRERGYEHDYAMSATFLGKIYSGVGFQRQAARYFAEANRRFREYDTLQETAELLFWSTATEARHCTLLGHTRESVATARALMRIYRRLFDGIRRTKEMSSWHEELEALRDGLHLSDPVVAEVMLELRLGFLPEPFQRQALEALQSAAVGELTGGIGEHRENLTAKVCLCELLLRLVHLQESGEALNRGRIEPDRELPDWLTKFSIRRLVLTALESAAGGEESNPLETSLLLQRALKTVGRFDLRGGLAPFLVDFSQFFVHRDSYIALVLRLLQALDTTIECLPDDPEAVAAGLQASLLRGAYRSLTKYLALERNFYAGPPGFTAGSAGEKLWRRLSAPRERDPSYWQLVYRLALQGKHGLSYPTNAFALGWVESVATGSAHLRLLWVADQAGQAIAEQNFLPLEVPIEIVARGRAHCQLHTPIVLIGRSEIVDDGEQQPEWAVHRLPADIAAADFFDELKNAPWIRPRIAAWRSLLQRFQGRASATCETHQVTEQEISDRFEVLLREWFGSRFQEHVLMTVFNSSGLHAPERSALSAPTNETDSAWEEPVALGVGAEDLLVSTYHAMLP